MGTVFVTVTPECEGLISTLPRGTEWCVESETYNEDGSSIIEISFDDDDLTGAAEQALNTNDNVISYHVKS